MTISYAQLLGNAPLPPKTVQGRKHIPEGYREARPAASGATKSVRDRAAERRAAILAMLREEPTTALEIMAETDSAAGIIENDLKLLIKSNGVQYRMHKGENLYWVAA